MDAKKNTLRRILDWKVDKNKGKKYKERNQTKQEKENYKQRFVKVFQKGWKVFGSEKDGCCIKHA